MVNLQTLPPLHRHCLQPLIQIDKWISRFILLDLPLLSSKHRIQLLHWWQLDIDPAIFPLLDWERRNIDLIVIPALARILATKLIISLMVWAAHPQLILLPIIPDQTIRQHKRTLVRAHLLRTV